MRWIYNKREIMIVEWVEVEEGKKEAE